jgi:type IV pilus assembly protein PilF
MNFRIAIITTVCILTLACGTTEKSDRNKTKSLLFLEMGTTNLTKGLYPQALRDLMQAEQYDPENSIIQNNLGLAYMVREKYAEAEDHFKRALEIDDKYTDARNNLGLMYMEIGMFPLAISTLETAAADLTYEQPEKSLSNLGRAYFSAKQYSKAKDALRKSLSYRKGNCATMNFYGRSLFELGEYAAAAESLDQAVTLCEKSNFEEPHFYSGMSFYKLGNSEKARVRFEEIVNKYTGGKYVNQSKEMLELLK